MFLRNVATHQTLYDIIIQKSVTWILTPERSIKFYRSKERVGGVVTLWTSIRCAWVDSGLGHRLSSLKILCFSLVAPDKYQGSTSITPWPLPSKSFPIHGSLIIIPLHTVHDTDQLTPWGRSSVKKLIGSQIVKHSQHLMETECSLPCSQEVVTNP
jgi:hypothetical protein